MTEACGEAQTRLHNCGPGPREVFRCAPIGASVEIDLATVLAGWDAMPWHRSRTIVSRRRDPDEDDPVGMDSRFIEPTFVSMCGHVLERLEVPYAPGHDMATMVRRVVAVVLERAWHHDLLGLAGHTMRDPQVWLLGTGFVRNSTRFPSTSTRDVALAIAAHAVYAPPLLLWTRVPSLDWLRTDISLQLRCPWQAGAR
jgi:hypothetical protein